MNTAPLTASDVANFLRDHPDFLSEHAELFATLKVPHPQQGGAISLVERQVLTLREQLQRTQARLDYVLTQATRNHRISQQLLACAQSLLALPSSASQIDAVRQCLLNSFQLDQVSVWYWADSHPASHAQPDEAVMRYAQQLTTPYSGPRAKHPLVDLLHASTQSLAAFRLLDGQQHTIGLVLLEDKAERFEEDMATDYLAQLSQLCSACLSADETVVRAP